MSQIQRDVIITCALCSFILLMGFVIGYIVGETAHPFIYVQNSGNNDSFKIPISNTITTNTINNTG